MAQSRAKQFSLMSNESAPDEMAQYLVKLYSVILLFPVDRDTHEFFCRLQSNVFNAASLFQTNHVVH